MRLAEPFVAALAALHRFEWRGTPVETIDGARDVARTAADASGSSGRAACRQWTEARVPMLEWAAIWLRANAPVAPRICIVHGDFRIGNFLDRRGPDHRDPRLGARASRRSARGSRLDLPAGLARPLALYVPSADARGAAAKYSGAHRRADRRRRLSLLGGLRHLQARGDALAPRIASRRAASTTCAWPAWARSCRGCCSSSSEPGARGMNISLERLLEGMIATLRAHVVDHVADPYARGQAIGVIDLISNIGPRIEWARVPMPRACAARGSAAGDGRRLPARPTTQLRAETMDLAELGAERDRLDGEICDPMAVRARALGPSGRARALGLIDPACPRRTRARDDADAQAAVRGNRQRRRTSIRRHLPLRAKRSGRHQEGRYMASTRSSHAEARPMRAALHARPDSRRSQPRQGVRDLRRRLAMDLSRGRARSRSAPPTPFARLGVKQGDRVLVWLPNSADCLRVWFGLNYLGAVFVPINLAYKGGLLQHALNIRSAAGRRPRGSFSAARRRRAQISCATSSCWAARRAVEGLTTLDPHALESDDAAPPALERRNRALGHAVDHPVRRAPPALEGRPFVLFASL